MEPLPGTGEAWPAAGGQHMLWAVRLLAILLLVAAVALPGGHGGPPLPGGHIGPPLRAGGKRPPAAPVNVNTATLEQLQALPGIGPAMARSIGRHRERNGPFRRVEELLIIRGMSKKKLARLKPYLRVK